MLRIGVSTLLSAGSVLFAFSACGGRTADAEQSLQATGGTFGASVGTTAAQTTVGGSSTAFTPVHSGGEPSVGGSTPAPMTTLAGGNGFVPMTTLTGGTYGAGGVPTNIGGATLIAVGGTLCAVAYNGQTYTTLVSQALCGNGAVEYTNGELCDDGNRLSGDGCSSACRVEANYPCGDGCAPCVSIVVCGDGRVTGGEQCDDGNLEPGDGCNATCLIEPLWHCPVPGKPCLWSLCGDGILQWGEQCDDGWRNGNIFYGQCRTDCTLPPYCGDGVVQSEAGETCDDGVNDGSQGHCAPNCTITPYCGDGIVQSEYGEACDEGATNNNGAYGHCAPNCTMPALCNEAITYLDGGVVIRSGCQ